MHCRVPLHGWLGRVGRVEPLFPKGSFMIVERILWEVAAEKQRGQLKLRPRKPFNALTYCTPTLPYSAPFDSSSSLSYPPNIPLYSLSAPLLRPFAPSILPLKRPCSLSRSNFFLFL